MSLFASSEQSSGPADIDVRLYQPIYASGQGSVGDGFAPLVLTDNSHRDWRELWIIVDMYRRGMHREARFTGLLSPKFSAKTGLGAQDVIEQICRNPKRNVYLFCPAPHLPYMSFNVWEHGALYHPGLLGPTQAWLETCGIEWELAKEGRHGRSISCYSNFWVADELFWEAYVGGILRPLAEYLEAHPKSEVSVDLLASARYHVNAPFLPFAAERLFTTFLAHNAQFGVCTHFGDPVSSAQYAFRQEIVRHMREIVDRADGNDPFPDDIRCEMALLSKLVWHYEELHYLHNPRPWT